MSGDNIRYFTPKAARPLTWVRNGGTWRAVEAGQRFTVEPLASGSIVARMQDDTNGTFDASTFASVEQAKAWCSARRRRLSVTLPQQQREGA